jgi:hypothetical protein
MSFRGRFHSQYWSPNVVTAQGRLTLTSGVPVTTADVAGVGTIYYTPSTGRLVPLWDGAQFVPTSIGVELSNVLANSADGKAGQRLL